MNTDKKLLQHIHKNAAMGVNTIPQVLSMPQSRAMSQSLNDQLREYRSIAACAQRYARRHGKALKGPGTAVLVMSKAMLQAHTIADHSTSRLAELMIRGNTMGTVKTTRCLHQLSVGARPALAAPGQQLLCPHEQHIPTQQCFL